MGGVGRHRGERLRRRELELGAGERADERQAGREGAARVEVCRERDRSAGGHEVARPRLRAVEEERAGRQQHADHGAGRECGDPVVSRRLEVVDRARAELDGERDRAPLGELVAVQPQRQAGGFAGLEVAPGLGGVEGAAFEEDVCRVGQRRRLRQHLGDRPVEVRIGVRLLGRHCMGAEPGRRSARVADGAQRRQLGVPVEPVPRLAFPAGRSVSQHPAGVPLDAREQLGLAERTGRGDGREDAASSSVQLLVARAGCTEGELLRPVAAERGMRVAVDQPGDCARPAPVELLELALRHLEVTHAPDRLDRRPVAEHVGVLDHLDRAEVGGPRRQGAGVRRRDLGEIADEQARHRAAPR